MGGSRQYRGGLCERTTGLTFSCWRGEVFPVLLDPAVGGLTSGRLARGKALTHILTWECREKCASRRKNLGLNKEKGWGRRALKENK